jgi:pimeloyl-ACP methyl ester carboxylesterase
MMAQKLTLARPDRVLRLVLGCTHASFRAAEQPAREVGRVFASENASWSERMGRLAPLAFAAGVAPPELVAHLAANKALDVQTPEGYRAQVEAVVAHDALDRLPLIEPRTLVLTGDGDQVIPASNSRVLAERIPSASLHVIEGAGHLFLLEQPEETQRVLEALLA